MALPKPIAPLLFVILLILFAIKITTAINYPFFDGDGGYRLHSAHLPIVRLENRIWLPLLQIHVWFLYLLQMPSDAFKIIPFFYYFVALVFLCLITYRITVSLLFTALIAASFSFQFYLSDTSFLLGQESMELAFFYALIWLGALELRKTKWLIPVCVAALLTRETFWIYLLTITILNWKTIVSNKVYRISFLCLWTVPVLWLSAIAIGYWRWQSRLPAFPLEWPLGVNTSETTQLLGSCRSLWVALVSSKTIVLVTGLLAVFTMVRFHEDKKNPNVSTVQSFRSRFAFFSLLSIALIYVLIILFNPWQATFGNRRMAAPMLGHAYLWATILYAETRFLSGGNRAFTQVILAASLILPMNFSAWIPPGRFREQNAIAEIKHLVDDASRDQSTNVCFFGLDYWDALEVFVGPTLYARRHIYKDVKARANCDVIIARPGLFSAAETEFPKRRQYVLRGNSYEVFARK